MVNPAWETILGEPPDAVAGRSFRAFIWEEDATATAEALAAAADHDLTGFENRFRHRDGTPRWISWHTSREGDLIYAYGRDVTEERRGRRSSRPRRRRSGRARRWRRSAS
jgi:PAS domain S-box-containing protein